MDKRPLRDLAEAWDSHPQWTTRWKLEAEEIVEILNKTNEVLRDTEDSLPQEVLDDIACIIIGLEPLKQALPSAPYTHPRAHETPEQL